MEGEETERNRVRVRGMEGTLRAEAGRVHVFRKLQEALEAALAPSKSRAPILPGTAQTHSEKAPASRNCRLNGQRQDYRPYFANGETEACGKCSDLSKVI